MTWDSKKIQPGTAQRAVHTGHVIRSGRGKRFRSAFAEAGGEEVRRSDPKEDVPSPQTPPGRGRPRIQGSGVWTRSRAVTFSRTERLGQCIWTEQDAAPEQFCP